MNKFMKSPVYIITVSCLSLALLACGGGSDEKSHPSEPIKISALSWKDIRSKSPKKVTAITSSVFLRTNPNNQGTHPAQLGFKATEVDSDDIKHWQVLFDTDNDSKTGFQYIDEAWSKQSGIDYIIEDGHLYKSTANDSSWSWEFVSSIYINPRLLDDGIIDFRIPLLDWHGEKKEISGLCETYNFGFIELDKNWKIEKFYPKANKLLKQKTSFCDNPNPNQHPVISLNGLSPMTVALNSQFIDPGATATDAEDGDISSNIIASNNVNTSVASKFYSVLYSIKDSAGAVTTKNRRVIVKDNPPSSGIVIDGNDGDWAGITSLTQSSDGTMKVTDDKDFIYIMVNTTSSTSNWQLHVDTDSNSQTGYLRVTGAGDYMIENNDFYQYTGSNSNQFEWAWKYFSDVINEASQSNFKEIAIPKSAFHNLGNKPNFLYKNITSAWDFTYTLPQNNRFISYTLKFPELTNHAPDAVEDSPSTNHTVPITINVLLNDTDPDGDTLTVISIIQPPFGTATLNANGTILFDPQGHVGSHSISYTISDGRGGTDTAIATIATSDPNGGHGAYPDISDENVTTPKNTPIFIDVLANDSDADGDVLILDQVDSGGHGTTTKVNGGVLYTPEAGYTGTDEFYYGVHDGHGHNGAGKVTVTITP